MEGIGSESLLTLCDPQTSGGLLVAVDADHHQAFELFLCELELPVHEVARLISSGEKVVYVRESV